MTLADVSNAGFNTANTNIINLKTVFGLLC